MSVAQEEISGNTQRMSFEEFRAAAEEVAPGAAICVQAEHFKHSDGSRVVRFWLFSVSMGRSFKSETPEGALAQYRAAWGAWVASPIEPEEDPFADCFPLAALAEAVRL